MTAHSQERTVLVIDDDKALGEALLTILHRNGYQALLAESGLEGLNLARTSDPSLILCDACMPGLSGLEVVIRLRQDAHTVGTPVILMSGRSMSADAAECAQLSVSLLAKPFTPSELVEAISSELNYPG